MGDASDGDGKEWLDLASSLQFKLETADTTRESRLHFPFLSPSVLECLDHDTQLASVRIDNQRCTCQSKVSIL